MQYQKSQLLANPLGALRLIKISLLIFLLGMCVVGKRKSTWPIMSWALYSEYSARFQPPEPTVTNLELRVITIDGQTHIVKPKDVLTMPRDSLSYRIIEQAFSGEDAAVRVASQDHLRRSLSILLHPHTEIERVQVWEKIYPVAPLSVPPVQIDSPKREVMLGSFPE